MYIIYTDRALLFLLQGYVFTCTYLRVENVINVFIKMYFSIASVCFVEQTMIIALDLSSYHLFSVHFCFSIRVD